MNRNKLKTYAPKARRAFIEAVTARAAFFGITEKGAAPVERRGDVVVIGGQPYPAKIGEQREKLEQRIKLRGFEQVMEEAAYTWFNRFAAIRFMELHGYLDHGFHVLSHPQGKAIPEILEKAEHVELPGLDRDKVIELKLDGTRDEELYRILLTGQCNALHRAMPFLFERIDDDTELLMPDNLLHSNSLIRGMVEEIEEADWQSIEIIGWLYQFYISERKDQVIGKVVSAEGIPAATQLFTPSWIVKYMVQNSLGAQWLATYPDSPLKGQMEYYIEPAEQTEDVQRHLDEITPKEVNPEELTLMDPACGSGHILVEAYDLFKAIYLERGYRLRDISRLILEKNLYGLDIDDRAAQMAGFALLMKARADDRRIMAPDNPPAMNVIAIQDSRGLDADEIARTLLRKGRFELVTSDDLLPDTVVQPALSTAEENKLDAKSIRDLIEAFSDARTRGSLIRLPGALQDKLGSFQALVKQIDSDDLYQSQARAGLRRLVKVSDLLSRRYSVAVANPPYMGMRLMEKPLKDWIKNEYPDEKANLFSCFMTRCRDFVIDSGFFTLVTLQNWMFLSSFEKVRIQLLERNCLTNLTQIGFNSFPELNSKVALASAFVFRRLEIPEFVGQYINCNDAPKSSDKEKVFKEKAASELFSRSSDEFRGIPGSPVAYWVSERLLAIFRENERLGSVADARQGLATSDNDRFLRQWWEVSFEKIGLNIASHEAACSSGKKWFPYNKGSGFRRWYAESDSVINWEKDGDEIITYAASLYGSATRTIKNIPFYFKEGLTWTDISLAVSARLLPKGHIFDTAGPIAFFKCRNRELFSLSFLNSSLCTSFRPVLNPTLHFTLGDLENLPFPLAAFERWQPELVKRCIEITKSESESRETSTGFKVAPAVSSSVGKGKLSQAFDEVSAQFGDMRYQLKSLEEENNKFYIDTYNLHGEISAEVLDKDIAIPSWDAESEAKELLSFAIGCIVGRYSLDEPGLIYAHSGDEGFDPSRYGAFPADEDGIVPVTETDWFEDDAANRFVEFLRAVWLPEHLNENLKVVADSLSPKKGETPLDSVRRYLSQSFFKDHVKTYRKRPIYWLFSSGKQKAFECIVYLHRYNESTLSRMRMEYVTPLQSRINARVEHLESTIPGAASTAARKRLEKERDKLVQQRQELRRFDEELRHYADMRISLDLDDGVKVNYGKFGDLLAERKAVTGEK